MRRLQSGFTAVFAVNEASIHRKTTALLANIFANWVGWLFFAAPATNRLQSFNFSAGPRAPLAVYSLHLDFAPVCLSELVKTEVAGRFQAVHDSFWVEVIGV